MKEQKSGILINIKRKFMCNVYYLCSCINRYINNNEKKKKKPHH